MKLPTEKSTIDLLFKDQKIGVIGSAGIGKSSFFAEDPNALFIEAEAGLNFLKVFKVPARCWEDLREIYVELRKLVKVSEFDKIKEKEGAITATANLLVDNKMQKDFLEKKKENESTFPYSIIVVDTIDRIVDFAEEEIVKRAKDFYKTISNEINCVADVPNGAGWAKQKDLVMGFLNKLEELPCAVAYIGHLQTKEIKEGAQKFNKDTINIGGKLGLELLAWPDHLLHIKSQLQGEKLIRRVRTKPSQSIEAKSRGGIVPDMWLWEEDMGKNYGSFRGLFK